jgi:hypothetical protein
MNDQAYEYVLRIAVEEAQSIDKPADSKDDSAWDHWHAKHFDSVLAVVDNSDYSFIEAREISDVCQEVENDIRHGDILGL